MYRLVLRAFYAIVLISWIGFCTEWIFSGYTTYLALQNKIEAVAVMQKNLRLEIGELEKKIERGNDPVWMEYLLIERLGMVPEGASKVVFRERHD